MEIVQISTKNYYNNGKPWKSCEILRRSPKTLEIFRDYACFFFFVRFFLYLSSFWIICHFSKFSNIFFSFLNLFFQKKFLFSFFHVSSFFFFPSFLLFTVLSHSFIFPFHFSYFFSFFLFSFLTCVYFIFSFFNFLSLFHDIFCYFCLVFFFLLFSFVFSFFSFFFLFFHLLFVGPPSRHQNRNKNRRELLVVKMTVFFCENILFWPRWTRGRAGNGPFEGDPVFLFFISLFHFLKKCVTSFSLLV